MEVRSYAKWAVFALCGLYAGSALAQLPPPPPQPLGPAPIPVGNPQSAAKINLGKALFWEEQLSITGTVACGTCHSPSGGGADLRSAFGGLASTHPGPDSVFGTADDIVGAAGVPAHSADGAYQPSVSHGFAPQVGKRKSPSAVNAAFSPLLFWDGRAGNSFSDPVSGTVLVAQGGALENQALGPLLDSSEMAPAGAVVGGIADRLSQGRPLALASEVPEGLLAWMAGRDYASLFAEVFGTPEITPARIALAIASYERTLVANQTPIDSEFGGTPSLTQLERQGQQVFIANDCAACHSGNLFSDNLFHYIGLRPPEDDLGRFTVTGNPQQRGSFRTPSLRNVGLRGPFMHTGRFASLEEVVEFYNRGGDFNAPNKDPRIRPRALTAQQKTALLAFLRRPLTDPRVGAELAPFDRPTLYTESDRVPAIVGSGVVGSAGLLPEIVALEPPYLGNRNFTVVVANALGGAEASLVVGHSDPGVVASLPIGDFAEIKTVLHGSGAGNGYASVQLSLEDPALAGQTLYGRYYIGDPGAANSLAITPAFRIAVFGDSDLLFRNGFE